ncbi:MAG TPA: hypothetical protein VHM24_06250, partial [Gemmatimonadaceae bacterium]|nr:hypothetical protein [Gemmatimonadaceae bacterium]
NLGALAAGAGEEKEDTPPTALPDGRTFRRTSIRKRVRSTEQISDVALIYYVTGLDGRTDRVAHEFSMRWFWRFEIEHLLARCGFVLSAIYGNFDRSALVDGSPEMIFVAEHD